MTGKIDLAASAQVGWLPQDDRELLPDDHLHRFLFAHDAARAPVASLSPGELRRLALARLVLAGANLLLLDEPTNHLDLPTREAYEASLATFEGATPIVTHDRYFIEHFADRLLRIDAQQVLEV
ncbi:MAG: ATP-binding cassette domain-containing protein [Chloroflexi bacterium]|nr:ATP-binding cassette domain-containing protein [Chloroflexota bacterium]MDA1146221.1 ATP-binding cassette domain-containing protein [Chloroflexota bacterium]